jgi:hypothetical protein
MPTDRQKRDAKSNYPRDLMIKTKAAQRMFKEVSAYEKEVVDNTAKLEDMKNDSTKDEYDVKRFEGVLQESLMMVPDSKIRLQKSIEDLSLFLDTACNEEGVKESEWWTIASDLVSKENVEEKNDKTVVDVDEGEAF